MKSNSLETRDAKDICLSSNFSVLDCPVTGNAIKTRHRFFFAIPTSIAAIIAFLMCQVVIVLVPPVVQRSSFLAGAIEKHKLLNTTPSPRLILVGGSNVAFGFDSEYLSRVLKLPVINMALHGGLGLRFALNEVAPYIRKNDLIVVAPEYPQFDDPNGDLTLLQLLSVYPQSLMYISPENVASFPRAYLQFLQFKRKWWAFKGLEQPHMSHIYNRFAFNTHGDMIAHLNSQESAYKSFPARTCLMSSPSEDNGTVSALRNFEHTCAAKGAKVFFSFAPVPSAYFNDPYNNRVIHKLVDIIKNRTNLPILNAPEDTVFPSTYFFDTPDHLKKEARLLRTQRLAKSLNQIGI